MFHFQMFNQAHRPKTTRIWNSIAALSLRDWTKSFVERKLQRFINVNEKLDLLITDHCNMLQRRLDFFSGITGFAQLDIREPSLKSVRIFHNQSIFLPVSGKKLTNCTDTRPNVLNWKQPKSANPIQVLWCNWHAFRKFWNTQFT